MTCNVRTSQKALASRAEHEWGDITWLAGAELNGSEGLTLGRVVIRKGCCNPRHGHEGCDEVLYLMAGKLEHSVGDESVILEPGDTLLVRAGSFHNAKSIGDVDADMIVAYSSGTRDIIPENPDETD